LLQNREQMMFDMSAERERRRAERGFASPADARAFLQMSRHVRPESVQPSNPVARDYFRSIQVSGPPEGGPAQDENEPSHDDAIEIAELLAEAGITPLQAPRALLESGDAEESSTRIQRCMRVVLERDPVAFGERNFELAYLANILISGCSIQARPFTQKEAADGAVAICNLGLERVDPEPDVLITRDLVGVFQIGWTVLHEDVCMFAANSFCEALRELRVTDDDLQSSLNLLRIRLLRAIEDGTPWHAATALDVLMSLDVPAWAGLVGLIAECPVIHEGLVASVDRKVRQVDPNAFQFIAREDQVALVRRFVTALPDILL
jgi:hypothetical protein